MNAFELLDTLNRRAVGLRVDGDRLRLTASREVLTPELLADIKLHKQQLIAILTGADPDTIARRPRPDAPVPVAFAQRQLWFLDQLSPGNPFYNNPVAFDVVGALDVPVLTRALTEVVRRHEALRTVFALVDDEPCQVVRPAAPVALPVTDLTSLPRSERSRRADQPPRPRRGRRSTWPPVHWYAAPCSGWPPTSTAGCSPCTTWWPTAGPSAS